MAWAAAEAWYLQPPDQCVRISPAAARSPKPSNATNKLYGSGYGAIREVPGDNSCFYHSVREHVMCDADLHCDKQSMELIGKNATDLCKNIKAICDGKSDNMAFDDVNVGEMVTFDLRGDGRRRTAPPRRQSTPSTHSRASYRSIRKRCKIWSCPSPQRRRRA